MLYHFQLRSFSRNPNNHESLAITRNFNIVYPITIAAIFGAYVQNKQFRKLLHQNMKKMVLLGEEKLVNQDFNPIKFVGTLYKSFCTSPDQTKALLEETEQYGCLFEGPRFDTPNDVNLTEKDASQDLDSLNVLDQKAVELQYEVKQHKASKSQFDLDLNLSVSFSFGIKVKVEPELSKKDFGKPNLGKGTTEPMNPINRNYLSMPGLDRYGITKSDALAAAQQIAHRTGSIEMATIYLSNAAVPTAKIRDVFGNEQTPWRAGDPPVLVSSYEGSPEEAIACSTIVEGLMQMYLGFDTFKDKFMSTTGYPSWSPFLYKDGIPYEKGNLEVDRERLFGNKIGKGRKVCLLKLSEKSNDLYYSVETHKIMFCRRMHHVKFKKTLWLDPEIKIFSTKHFCNGHYANGFCKIDKGDIKDRMCEKFKVL